MQIYENVVVGNPLVKCSELLAKNEEDYSKNEFSKTLFTEETWLPRILVECGIVDSTSEVKRNRSDLWINLKDMKPDFFKIKWGKKFLWVVVGEFEDEK